MVAGSTKTRHNTPEERAALDAARARLLALQRQLGGLVDRDAQAYDEVVGAYRQPKGTDEEKAARSRAIQAALRLATAVPLETLTACVDAVEIGREVARAGNPAAITDVAVGIQSLNTAASGALLNVQINLGSVKDEAFVHATTADVRRRVSSLGDAMRDVMTTPGITDLYRQSAELAGTGHGRPPAGPVSGRG
jgi:formiminotetrahydrofolate cyclodeaminase